MTNEQQQFEQFVSRYQDSVYSAAMRVLANAADAEDVAQEVFIRAYKKFPNFDGVQNIELWLKRIAINLSLNYITRYRKRWRFFSEIFSAGDSDRDLPEIEYADCSNKTAEEIDYCHFIDNLLKTLPAAQRVPLALYHFEGLSYEQIASKLAVSLSKVKTDIHRGRLELRKKIIERYGEEDGLTAKASEENSRSKRGAQSDEKNIYMKLTSIFTSKKYLPL